MTSSDIIATFAAGLSALSLIVSLWAAYKASKFSNYQLRLSNRSDLHNMLLEIDREMLHDPTLSSMFKSNPTFSPSPTSPTATIKEDTYVYMHLNLFELSFAQFKEIKDLSSVEKEVSAAWDRTIISFFEDCPRATHTWLRFRETYYSSFRDYIDRLIADTSPSCNSAKTAEQIVRPERIR